MQKFKNNYILEDKHGFLFYAQGLPKKTTIFVLNNKPDMIQSQKKLAYIDMTDVVVSITNHKVKVTHIPTQTVIESCQNKCPYKNKASALTTLRKVLFEKLAS